MLLNTDCGSRHTCRPYPSLLRTRDASQANQSTPVNTVFETEARRNTGVLLCVGTLPAGAERTWRANAERIGLPVIATERFDECVLHASSQRAVCLLTAGSGLKDQTEATRLFDPSDSVFRRVAVVLLLSAAKQDPRGRTVWDTISADAREPEADAALRAALTAARQRLSDWEAADDFHRRRETLTDEEADVLRSVCAGKLNKQIAAEFKISIRTVEQRRRRVFTKMGVESAVPLARRVGLVEALERHTLRRDASRPGGGPTAPNLWSMNSENGAPSGRSSSSADSTA